MHAYTMLLREKTDEKTKQVKYYLEETNNLPVLKKIYGNTDEFVDRVFVHYENTGEISTGVLSHGYPGTGKTVLLNRLSQRGREEYRLPTVLVTKAPSELSWRRISDGTSDGGLEFLKFIRDLPECIIALDEFEKTFGVSEQERLLTMYDGAFTSKKILMHTINKLHYISNKLLGRPNRIHFEITHGSVSSGLIREYCLDNLNDTSKIEYIVEYSKRFKIFTIDALRAVVIELNNNPNKTLYDNFKYLNLSDTSDYSSTKYKVSVKNLNKEVLTVVPSSISIPPDYGDESDVLGNDDSEISYSKLSSLFFKVTDPNETDKITNVDLSDSNQEYDKHTDTITIRWKDKYIFIFEKNKIEKRQSSTAYD